MFVQLQSNSENDVSTRLFTFLSVDYVMEGNFIA